MSIRGALIYSTSQNDFEDRIEKLKQRALAEEIQLEIFDVEHLDPNEEDRFLRDIRSIPPQIAGNVKSQKGRKLPISGSGKLSRATPILIFYEGLKPLDVYPKNLFGVEFTLDSAFKSIGSGAVLGVEASLVTVVSSRPELLGSGLDLVEREFETDSGRIDLLFKDKYGTYVVVEAKEEANQETVGQILKQSNGLKTKLALPTVRRAIVALRTSENVRAACEDAGIELYVLSMSKLTSNDRK